ncbi:MAG: acyl-[acyl-carrier-protein] thioesterase [Acidimicrobiales bacterium]|nr:acyl-[acyl-carrier-protein] thioesterase [Acidimicrobiales bacterium]
MPVADPLVPLPRSGRTFGATTVVRLGDVSPAGRLRLDALARYLQDVAGDDAAAAGLPGEQAWVVRRTVLRVDRPAVLGEHLRLTTWCAGLGPRWADRRTSVVGDQGGGAEAASLWVYVDPRTGRPLRLPPGFHERYGESAGGRTVRARLALPDPPAGATSRPWPLRFADFDALGHVNNAVSWAAIEDALAPRRELRAPLEAVVEWRSPLERGAEPELVTADAAEGRAAGLAAWLVDRGAVVTAAQVGQRRA